MTDQLGIERFPRDLRTATHLVRLENGGAAVLDGSALRRRVDGWPVTAATPEHAATMLSTSRWLVVLGSVHYELFTVSVAWSLLAVEAGLNSLYPTAGGGRTPSFGPLVRRAVADGRLDATWGERLDAARQLRDGFVHPAEELTLSPPMAVPMVEAAHEVVALLFPEGEPG